MADQRTPTLPDLIRPSTPAPAPTGLAECSPRSGEPQRGRRHPGLRASQNLRHPEWVPSWSVGVVPASANAEDERTPSGVRDFCGVGTRGGGDRVADRLTPGCIQAAPRGRLPLGCEADRESCAADLAFQGAPRTSNGGRVFNPPGGRKRGQECPRSVGRWPRGRESVRSIVAAWRP